MFLRSGLPSLATKESVYHQQQRSHLCCSYLTYIVAISWMRKYACHSSYMKYSLWRRAVHERKGLQSQVKAYQTVIVCGSVSGVMLFSNHWCRGGRRSSWCLCLSFDVRKVLYISRSWKSVGHCVSTCSHRFTCTYGDAFAFQECEESI